MAIRRFYIIGNGDVIDVGIRPALITIAADYALKVAARNLEREKKVEVIVEGPEDNIEEFYRHVKEHDIRPIKRGKRYEVSKTEPYEGPEVDWTAQATASVMEQITKGVTSLDNIQNKLGRLDDIQSTLKRTDRKFDTVIDRFGEFRKGLDRVDNNLGKGLDKIYGKLDELVRAFKPRKK